MLKKLLILVTILLVAACNSNSKRARDNEIIVRDQIEIKSAELQEKVYFSADAISDKEAAKGKLYLVGNVVIQTSNDTILADEVVIYGENKTTENKIQSKIRKIEAKGNVRVFSKDFVANSRTGYLDFRKELLVLENDVLVNSKTSIETGNKFIYNLKTKKFELLEKNRKKLGNRVNGYII
jgi:lipopolysaccharide export system protein LptA